MTHSARNWPGGIPSCIQRHPTGNLSIEALKEATKGWLLFVKETWVPCVRAGIADDEHTDNGEYELRQRRKLVEEWASASQEFRDVRHSLSYCVR
ncbi:uncharacterized protein BDV17DRAFT_289908 [Aspergillus undulatus]|uniref:uncharacterized protein n=1 Tax=Aspergillus undulatus TaxID=1810928 RepID=UPI003CCE0158